MEWERKERELHFTSLGGEDTQAGVKASGASPVVTADHDRKKVGGKAESRKEGWRHLPSSKIITLPAWGSAL